MDDLKRMGKYVSMLLRHHPEEAGVVLDEHGWTDVKDLIDKVAPRYPLTEELLHQLAFGKDKQRYEFSEDGTRVRAVHGHSVNVDLGYDELEPPASLIQKYRNLDSPYYTVDYAELEDGSWRVIEAGDGEVSGLSDGQDYEQYFRALYHCFN